MIMLTMEFKMSSQVRISECAPIPAKEDNLLAAVMKQMYMMQLSVLKNQLPSVDKIHTGIINALKKSEDGYFDPKMVVEHLPEKYQKEYETKASELYKSILSTMTTEELFTHIKAIDSSFEYNKPSVSKAKNDISNVLTSILMQ